MSGADIAGVISEMIISIITIAFIVFSIAGVWKMFEKAGEPGWVAIIPFVSNYKLCKIALGTGWTFLLLFIPLVNFVVKIMLGIKLAEAFGRGVLFGLGLAFIPAIFYMILGFGNATYQGVDAKVQQM